MTSTPILALPSFSQIFVVESDTNTQGIRAILSQRGHPLAYFCNKLSPRMTKALAYVRKLYAIT